VRTPLCLNDYDISISSTISFRYLPLLQNIVKGSLKISQSLLLPLIVLGIPNLSH
jgi:hypothetical protein